jgi:hypothetical protein
MIDHMHPLALAILQQDDRGLQPVRAPEWGITDLYARPLSSLDAEEAGKLQGQPELGAFIAARVLCDADGQRLFGDDAVPALAAKHFAPIRRAVAVAYQQAFLTQEAEQAMRGKSEQAAGSAPGSDSPSDSAPSTSSS